MSEITEMDTATIALAFGVVERTWRDQELLDTDNMVSITDHPQHSDYMAYRVALRNWPSTSDFPNIRPTL
tara:strand:+ start:839 stop:1048 length:210 start_codon:yes stop_codon:yes gene_type:complete